MIISPRNLINDQIVEADFCIAGGGPAAISLALNLPKTSKIVLIAGGGWSETSANQDLNRGIIVPPGSHEPLEENRRRQFGGASAVWGGRCVPLDSMDFKKRFWIDDSGWPITYEDMFPYYEQAAMLCQIGSFEFCANRVFPNKQKEIIEGFDSDEFVSNCLERWSPPIHFAKTYRNELENSTNIHILLDAQVLAWEMLADCDKITNAKVAVGKFTINIQAKHFLLATGAIENSRLLLTSANNYCTKGIGNEYDNVGRYYMAHLSGTYAELNLLDRKNVVFDFERDKQNVFCRRRWWIPEKIQESAKLLNTIFFLHHPNSLNGHRDALFSSVYVAKALLLLAKQRSKSALISEAKRLPDIKEHLINIAKNGLPQTPRLIQLGIQRLAKRRLPYILPSKSNKYWGLYFQTEQVPNRESRICLSKFHKDDLGIPRVEMKLAFKDIDTESVVHAHNLFVKNFLQKKFGEIVYSEDGLRQYLKNKINTFNSGAHHIGGTRMSDDPKKGVVDKNSKVYGVSNLFIAGSSVFPTGGHANPTLTIVAQALRLANHLKTKVP
ncbi:MAG: GMC oxidoreductase [Chitinophagaceae bacterium]